MSGQAARCLVTAEEHLNILHGTHGHAIALPIRTPSPSYVWDERLFFMGEDAVARATLGKALGIESFVSLAAFKSKKRSVWNVAALPAVFTDLDYYNVPALRELSPQALLAKITAENEWFPLPTILGSSGRGAYLIWKLDPPCSPESLPRWQIVQSRLVERLVPYGADLAAKDAARCLRLAESFNEKANRSVEYERIGAPVSFEDLERVLVPPPPKTSSPWEQRTEYGKIQRLLNGYSLAYARMTDLHTIASQRAPMTDCRQRMLFVLAVVCSWYCPTEEAVMRELSTFATSYFQDPKKYLRHGFRSVLDRMKQGKAGVKIEWRNSKTDPRYKLRNDYIIRQLQITEEEQRGLLTLIGEKEKLRRDRERKREKRRCLGASDRMARTAKRKRTVQKMLSKGIKPREVALRLRLHLSTVSRLVRG